MSKNVPITAILNCSKPDFNTYMKTHRNTRLQSGNSTYYAEKTENKDYDYYCIVEEKMEDGTIVTTRFDDENRHFGNWISAKHYKNGVLTYEFYTTEGGTTYKYYDDEGKVKQEYYSGTQNNIDYKYYSNGQVSEIVQYNSNTATKVIERYDENGNKTETIEQKGAVTTYYDAQGNPIRRVTDCGSGVTKEETLE